MSKNYFCPGCHENLSNPHKLYHHRVSCKSFYTALGVEFERIGNEIGHPGQISKREWEENRSKALFPGRTTLQIMFQKTWVEILADFGMTRTSPAFRRKEGVSKKYPIPKEWEDLLKPDQHISDYAPIENIRTLLHTIMVGTVFAPVTFVKIIK